MQKDINKPCLYLNFKNGIIFENIKLTLKNEPMKKTLFILSAFAIMLTSCGPNAQELAAREKIKMDSVAHATTIRIEREKASADSLAMAQAGTEMEKESLKEALSNAKVELQMAQDKLAKIKEYTLLRTASEKEAQLEAQYTLIQSLEDNIQTMQAELNKTN